MSNQKINLQDKFTRAVRYLSVSGNQTFVGQINQRSMRISSKSLPCQRTMFYVALVLISIGIMVGLWALNNTGN